MTRLGSSLPGLLGFYLLLRSRTTQLPRHRSVVLSGMHSGLLRNGPAWRRILTKLHRVRHSQVVSFSYFQTGRVRSAGAAGLRNPPALFRLPRATTSRAIVHDTTNDGKDSLTHPLGDVKKKSTRPIIHGYDMHCSGAARLVLRSALIGNARNRALFVSMAPVAAWHSTG